MISRHIRSSSRTAFARMFLLGLSLVAFQLFGGCGDDKKSPVGPTPTPDAQPRFSASVPAQSWKAGTPVTLNLPAATGGDAPLTYSLTPALPAGLTFNASARTISGTPASSARSYTYKVTDTDGDPASVTFQITVEAAPVVPSSVTVTPASSTLTTAGQTVRLTATVKDGNSQTIPGANVVWSSGDANVATVTAAGLVTAAGNGTTAITATAGSVMDSVD